MDIRCSKMVPNLHKFFYHVVWSDALHVLAYSKATNIWKSNMVLSMMTYTKTSSFYDECASTYFVGLIGFHKTNFHENILNNHTTLRFILHITLHVCNKIETRFYFSNSELLLLEAGIRVILYSAGRGLLTNIIHFMTTICWSTT